MPVEPLSLLSLFSATLILGYAGYLIFEKTGIPDIIWLLLLGLLLGPVFHTLDQSVFISLFPFLAALALLIILFDAGLNMDFYQVVKGFPRSMLLAVLNVISAMVVVGFLSVFLFKITLLQGLLMGAILGGTSSAIVVSVVSRLKIGDNIKTMLSLESIFNDPFTIVIPIALIGLIIQSANGSPVNHILSVFSVGAVIGFFTGIVWAFVLDMLKGRPFDYMLTLAMLFLVYVLAELVGGNGAIATLAFGVVLGNEKTISTMLKMDKKFSSVSHLFRTFQSEITFFIRSFFFVYLGIIVSINSTYVLYGIIISVVLILLRLAIVKVSTLGMKLEKAELRTMQVMAPRGLAAAVLSYLPVSMGVPNGQIFSDIVFIVILVTTIYTTVAVEILFRHKPNEEKKVEQKQKADIKRAEKEVIKLEKKAAVRKKQ